MAKTTTHHARPIDNSYRTVPADHRDHRDGRRAEWDCAYCPRTVAMTADGAYRHLPRR